MARITPMTVGNISFMLERMSKDCDTFQFVRELTQNGIEAITRPGGPGTGKIVWDFDDLEQTEGRLKLSVTDTGHGMTGEEMVEHINGLSSSAAVQALDGNYGVGAKISAITRNKFGVSYQSWKDGQGFRTWMMWDDEEKKYGARLIDIGGGKWAEFEPIPDFVVDPVSGANIRIKPADIVNHGTRVTLMGNSLEADTMQSPDGRRESRWIVYYLQSRYFEIPDGVEIHARENMGSTNSRLRTIVPQKKFLEDYSRASGVVNLTNAKAHWWILKDNAGDFASIRPSTGHAAALYKSELYEITKTPTSVNSRLLDFGITFGRSFIVIYVEPTALDMTTNTARTALLMNGESLPWSDWGAEFASAMPDEIESFMEEKAAGAANKDHTDDIREKLKGVLDLYKLSKFKVRVGGPDVAAEGDTLNGCAGSTVGGGGRRTDPEPRQRIRRRNRSALDVLLRFRRPQPGEAVVAGDIHTDAPFPKVQWLSLADGTRESGDLEDKAARYIPASNTLQINADFRVFTDMVSRWIEKAGVGRSAAQKQLVKESVHRAFEMTLTEVVMGMREFQNEREWSSDVMEAAMSPESLTCAVMPRFHTDRTIKKELKNILRARAASGE
jgi:hypothetical protein